MPVLTPATRPGVHFELKRRIPGVLEAVDPLTTELRRVLSGFSRRQDAFAAELLLREAVTNAVVHGCGMHPRRWLTVALRVRRDKLVLVVNDDGPGFDWRLRLACLAWDGGAGGRGLEIYKAYADQIRFNERGNRLVLVRRLSPAGGFAQSLWKGSRK